LVRRSRHATQGAAPTIPAGFRIFASRKDDSMVDNRSRVLASPLTRSRISRRGLVAGAGTLAATSTFTTYTPSAAAQFSGKIRMQAGAYTPSESMEKTANNPIPHDAIQRVAAQYMEANPDVEIEFVRVPEGTDARVWTVTQLTGGNAPEIVWTHSFDTNRDVGKGWWTNLLPYFEEPNPYITTAGDPGSERWIDQFFEGPTGAKFAANGEIYVVPYDLVTTFFFYNKALFEQAGVQIPTTYTQLLETIAKLDESGVPAYNGLRWSRPQLGEMLIGAWADEFEPTGIGGAYTQKDISLAILDGIYDATKIEYKEWLRLMKEGVPYWSEQWTIHDEANFDLQFAQGQLGIYEDGSWRFGLLNANDELEFEWGSFFMTTVEIGTGPGQSEYATGEPAPSIGGATAIQYGVTNSAEKNGVLDLCIDWLRYITAPEQASLIIDELGQFLPNIKGVEVNEDLRGPLEAVSSGPGEAGMIAYADKIDAEAAAQIDTATNNYLLGRAELDETAQAIQDLLYAQAEASAEANGWR
jgi:raffinose/stachyose/melibiose transport system substrate-binding protein